MKTPLPPRTITLKNQWTREGPKDVTLYREGDNYVNRHGRTISKAEIELALEHQPKPQ